MVFTGLAQEQVDAMEPAMSSLPGWEARHSRAASMSTEQNTPLDTPKPAQERAQLDPILTGADTAVSNFSITNDGAAAKSGPGSAALGLTGFVDSPSTEEFLERLANGEVVSVPSTPADGVTPKSATGIKPTEKSPSGLKPADATAPVQRSYSSIKPSEKTSGVQRTYSGMAQHHGSAASPRNKQGMRTSDTGTAGMQRSATSIKPTDGSAPGGVKSPSRKRTDDGAPALKTTSVNPVDISPKSMDIAHAMMIPAGIDLSDGSAAVLIPACTQQLDASAPVLMQATVNPADGSVSLQMSATSVEPRPDNAGNVEVRSVTVQDSVVVPGNTVTATDEPELDLFELASGGLPEPQPAVNPQVSEPKVSEAAPSAVTNSEAAPAGLAGSVAELQKELDQLMKQAP